MAADHISFKFDELPSDDTVPCKCCRFHKGADLPVPTDLDQAEIERTTKAFAASIFKDWTMLNAIVKRYEGAIQKRWMKKGARQRRQVLLQAWPGMSPTHRPDFKDLRSQKKRLSTSRTCPAQSYIWPYINVEDLSRRNMLLLLINSRGRNLPNTFRLADVKSAHTGSGWDIGIDFADSLEDYCCAKHYADDHQEDEMCMLFEDTHSSSKYGRLVTNHVKSLKPHQYKHLRRCNEGLLSLEIHQRTYRFLLECARFILHDIDPAMFFLAPTLPEPAMLGQAGPNEYPSLIAHSLESLYRTPQVLDLELLKAIVDSRRAAAEDHVWLLKEDPSYFMLCLREFQEHNGEKLPGECSPWAIVLERMITNAFHLHVFWDDVGRRLSSMAAIDVQLARANEKTVRLDKQDEEKFAALFEVLWQLFLLPTQMLYHGVPTSPRLRNKYRWRLSEDSESPGVGHWVMHSKASQSERRLDTLLFSIYNDHQRKLHGLHRLVQEVQYMFDTDVEAASVLDPWIIDQFSDIALVAEIINAIDALAPWFDEIKAVLIVDRHGVANKVERTRNLINKLDIGIKAATMSDKRLNFDPRDRDMLEYPAEKRRTKANVDQMIRAEERLDAFWQSLEASVSAAANMSLSKVLICRLRVPRTIHRTQPWNGASSFPSPPTSPPASPVVQNPVYNAVVSELDQNIHRPNHLDTPVSKRELATRAAKVKIKTHGTPSAPDPRRALRQDNLGAVEQAQGAPEKIGIPKRAFKVFTALLPSPSAAQQQRPELPWDDLLFAFNAIGLQPIKLYGSTWMFSPVEKGKVAETDAGVQTVGRLNLERSISFHEPKEVRKGAKIPKAMLRTFGRRLKHAYDWEIAENMFVCE